jgi:ParB family transcriptional regulator, chromosome partitioning protein
MGRPEDATAPRTCRMPIGTIRVGERVRKDMGDLASLAASMGQHGLLHPVVIKSDRTLVAGHRRLEAARLLEWQDIPVTVIDVDDLLSAERDENADMHMVMAGIYRDLPL